MLPLGLLCLCLASPVGSIWPFPPKRFTGNSLIGSGGMGLDSTGRVIAFGDFNGDQFLDVLSIATDKRTLTVYLWDHEEFIYKQSTTFLHPEDIHNVIPGDFTHDGKLDLLVMSQPGDTNRLNVNVYKGTADGGFDLTPISNPASIMPQPIPIDTNGDMKIDLIGTTFLSAKTSSPLRVWQNVWNESLPNSPLFELVSPNFSGTQCQLANPHSNAVVDLNGDCLADLFLMCDDGRGGLSYQIWVNKKSDGYALAQQGSLPAGTQAVSFADMNRDGTLDMVFTSCDSVSKTGVGHTGLGSNCYINVAYNQQLPLCSSTTAKIGSCRPPDNLCTADDNFSFEFTTGPSFSRFPVASLFPSTAGTSLLVLDITYKPAIPLSIKLGDANLDGFPDLLLVVDQGGSRVPKLAYSTACGKGVVGCSGPGTRGWKEAPAKGSESLNAITDARGVAFIDMDEDGTLDIMVQRSGKQNQGNVLFVQNNFYYDAFFMKAIVLNSACGNGWCVMPNRSQSYQPFGVSYSGATYKYTVLDTSGARSAAQVGQLPQTSYHSLLTPYSFFGLGRTNNYIENLFVGSTKHTNEHFINMEGVIPNSKVVIFPPPDSSGEGAAWKRELFLRPGEWIPWVTLTVIAGTTLLAGIVFVLHLNEKREDELERRRASHHINFDAL